MAKSKKKRQMTTRGRLIILGPICILLLASFVYTMFSYTASLYKLQKQKKELELELLEKQELSEDLKNEITKLQDPEYLAKYAREHYSYSKDGELIIKINSKKVEELVAQEEEVEWNQKMVIISTIVIGFIFLYILIRSTKKKKSA